MTARTGAAWAALPLLLLSWLSSKQAAAQAVVVPENSTDQSQDKCAAAIAAALVAANQSSSADVSQLLLPILQSDLCRQQAPSQGADKSLVIAVAVPLGVALFLLLLCMRAGLVLLRRRSRSRTTLSRQGSSRQASGGLRQQQTCSSKGLDGGAYDGGEDGLSIAGGGERRGLMHRYHPRRWLSRLGKAAAHVLGIHPRSGTHKDGSDLSVSDLGSLPSQLGAYALRGLRSLTHPSNKPPGVGPDTALLLTDVQNSTSLWEMLPTNVMDEAMRLHDDCLRAHLAAYQGYESASEGDAMILAFPSAAQALRYAVKVQAALLEAAWPGQMLGNPDGRSVYVLLDADVSDLNANTPDSAAAANAAQLGFAHNTAAARGNAITGRRSKVFGWGKSATVTSDNLSPQEAGGSLGRMSRSTGMQAVLGLRNRSFRVRSLLGGGQQPGSEAPSFTAPTGTPSASAAAATMPGGGESSRGGVLNTAASGSLISTSFLNKARSFWASPGAAGVQGAAGGGEGEDEEGGDKTGRLRLLPDIGSGDDNGDEDGIASSGRVSRQATASSGVAETSAWRGGAAGRRRGQPLGEGVEQPVGSATPTSTGGSYSTTLQPPPQAALAGGASQSQPAGSARAPPPPSIPYLASALYSIPGSNTGPAGFGRGLPSSSNGTHAGGPGHDRSPSPGPPGGMGSSAGVGGAPADIFLPPRGGSGNWSVYQRLGVVLSSEQPSVLGPSPSPVNFSSASQLPHVISAGAGPYTSSRLGTGAGGAVYFPSSAAGTAGAGGDGQWSIQGGGLLRSWGQGSGGLIRRMETEESIGSVTAGHSSPFYMTPPPGRPSFQYNITAAPSASLPLSNLGPGVGSSGMVLGGGSSGLMMDPLSMAAASSLGGGPGWITDVTSPGDAPDVPGILMQGGVAGLPPIECPEWGKQLGVALPRVREGAALKAGPGASCIIFRGLRVRMGIHVGLEREEDIVFEPVSGRTIYTGPLMEVARAVSDAAPGGGILLSAEAFVRLPHSALASTSTLDRLVNGGTMAITQTTGSERPGGRGKSFDVRSISYIVDGRTRQGGRGSSMPAEPIDALVVYAGDHRMTKLPKSSPPLALYMAVPAALPGRLAWMAPLRNTTPVARGTPAAPIGTTTIAFMNVCNAAGLLTELPTAARQAVTTFQNVCCTLLMSHKGYAVEVVDGLILAAFAHPADAVVWAIECQKAMSEQVWPEELVGHELCAVAAGERHPWQHSWSDLQQGRPEAGTGDQPQAGATVEGAGAVTSPQAGEENADISVPVQPASPPLPVADSSTAVSPATAPLSAADTGLLVLRPPSPATPAVTRASGSIPAIDEGDEDGHQDSSGSNNASPRHHKPVSGRGSQDAGVRIVVDAQGCTLGEGKAAGLVAVSQPCTPRAAAVAASGLRLKVGIDMGKVAATVVPLTGRIHYRGKVMNRCARVAARCRPGQVLVTSLVWKYSESHDRIYSSGVCGDELGEAEMKGVPGLVELVHVFRSHAEAKIRYAAAQKAAQEALAAANMSRVSPGSVAAGARHQQMQGTAAPGAAAPASLNPGPSLQGQPSINTATTASSPIISQKPSSRSGAAASASQHNLQQAQLQMHPSSNGGYGNSSGMPGAPPFAQRSPSAAHLQTSGTSPAHSASLPMVTLPSPVTPVAAAVVAAAAAAGGGSWGSTPVPVTSPPSAGASYPTSFSRPSHGTTTDAGSAAGSAPGQGLHASLAAHSSARELGTAAQIAVALANSSSAGSESQGLGAGQSERDTRETRTTRATGMSMLSNASSSVSGRSASWRTAGPGLGNNSYGGGYGHSSAGQTFLTLPTLSAAGLPSLPPLPPSGTASPNTSHSLPKIFSIPAAAQGSNSGATLAKVPSHAASLELQGRVSRELTGSGRLYLRMGGEHASNSGTGAGATKFVPSQGPPSFGRALLQSPMQLGLQGSPRPSSEVAAPEGGLVIVGTGSTGTTPRETASGLQHYSSAGEEHLAWRQQHDQGPDSQGAAAPPLAQPRPHHPDPPTRAQLHDTVTAYHTQPPPPSPRRRLLRANKSAGPGMIEPTGGRAAGEQEDPGSGEESGGASDTGNTGAHNERYARRYARSMDHVPGGLAVDGPGEDLSMAGRVQGPPHLVPHASAETPSSGPASRQYIGSGYHQPVVMGGSGLERSSRASRASRFSQDSSSVAATRRTSGIDMPLGSPLQIPMQALCSAQPGQGNAQDHRGRSGEHPVVPPAGGALHGFRSAGGASPARQHQGPAHRAASTDAAGLACDYPAAASDASATSPMVPMLLTQASSNAATGAPPSALTSSHSLAIPLPSLMAPLPELSSQAVYRSPRRAAPLQRVLQGAASAGGHTLGEEGGAGGSSGGGGAWEAGAAPDSRPPSRQPPMRANTAQPLTTQDSTGSQELGSVASSIVQRHKSGILSRDQHGVLRFAVLPRVPPPEHAQRDSLLIAARLSVDAAVFERERAARGGGDQAHSGTSGQLPLWGGSRQGVSSARGRSVDQVMGGIGVPGALGQWEGAPVSGDCTGSGGQQYRGTPFQVPAERAPPREHQAPASAVHTSAGPAPRASLHRLRVSASGPEPEDVDEACGGSSGSSLGEGPPASPPLHLNASDI